MALNGCGVRDTARVLGISKDTVVSALKKKEGELECVDTARLKSVNPEDVTVAIRRVDKAEVDETWAYVGNKKTQRWLWHAINHRTGTVLAYVLGRRKDEVFLELKALLEPFVITGSFTDYLGAYRRHLDPKQHQPGKRNTQRIGREHLTLPTPIKRLARKNLCFSRSIQMHDIVIGLFVNRHAFE